MSLPWPWQRCPHAHLSWHCLCAFPLCLGAHLQHAGWGQLHSCEARKGSLVPDVAAVERAVRAGTVLCHQPHRDPSPTWPGQGSFLNCCCKTLPVQAPEKILPGPDGAEGVELPVERIRVMAGAAALQEPGEMLQGVFWEVSAISENRKWSRCKLPLVLFF